MSKELFFTKLQEAAAASTVTFEVLPSLKEGEYKAVITGSKLVKTTTDEGEEKERIVISFKTQEGIVASQPYFAKKDWEEKYKEMAKGRTKEEKELLKILAKYGYIQKAIFKSIFKNREDVVTLPDFNTFINILIEEKEVINIDVKKELGKPDPQTGEEKSYTKIWFK